MKEKKQHKHTHLIIQMTKGKQLIKKKCNQKSMPITHPPKKKYKKIKQNHQILSNTDPF